MRRLCREMRQIASWILRQLRREMRQIASRWICVEVADAKCVALRQFNALHCIDGMRTHCIDGMRWLNSWRNASHCVWTQSMHIQRDAIWRISRCTWPNSLTQSDAYSRYSWSMQINATPLINIHHPSWIFITSLHDTIQSHLWTSHPSKGCDVTQQRVYYRYG